MAEVPTITEDDGRVIYDLDAYGAARREAEGTKNYVRLRGGDYLLPRAADVPIDMMDLVREGEMGKVVESLFPATAEEVKALHLSMEEFNMIVNIIMGVGDGVGESPASTT